MKKNANLGANFERVIEQANARYRDLGRAVVTKVPTPTKVVRKGKNIISAFHSDKAPVDFIGVAEGIAVAFEAKETKGKSIPLANFAEHQFSYMRDFERVGGRAFTLVHFSELFVIYIIEWQQIKEWIEQSEQPGGRKSIPVDYFEEHCKEIKAGYNVTCDWITAL